MNKKVLLSVIVVISGLLSFNFLQTNLVRAESGHFVGATAGSDLVVDSEGDKILGHIQTGIDLLTILAGVAITVSVIIGGIQYSTSGGNPNAAAAAKKRIGQAFVALLCLVFLYTFVQWLIPGGIF